MPQNHREKSSIKYWMDFYTNCFTVQILMHSICLSTIYFSTFNTSLNFKLHDYYHWHRYIQVKLHSINSVKNPNKYLTWWIRLLENCKSVGINFYKLYLHSPAPIILKVELNIYLITRTKMFLKWITFTN